MNFEIKYALSHRRKIYDTFAVLITYMQAHDSRFTNYERTKERVRRSRIYKLSHMRENRYVHINICRKINN